MHRYSCFGFASIFVLLSAAPWFYMVVSVDARETALDSSHGTQNDIEQNNGVCKYVSILFIEFRAI